MASALTRPHLNSTIRDSTIFEVSMTGVRPKTDRLYFTPAQVAAFRKGGEALLVQMGKALNQEAVTYETREGLTILNL